MTVFGSKGAKIFLSILGPFLIQSVLLYLDRKIIFGDSFWFDPFSILVSVSVGFLFLFKVFRPKIFWVGLFYFPVMGFVLFWYSFLFVGVVFGAFM